MHFLQLQLHPTPWDWYITNLHVHVYILSCRESFYLLLALSIMRVDAVVTCNLAFTKITKQANNTITFFCIMWASSEIKYQSDQSWMSLSAPTCYPREVTAWQACCIRGQHPNLLASTCSTLASSPMVVWITWLPRSYVKSSYMFCYIWVTKESVFYQYHTAINVLCLQCPIIYYTVSNLKAWKYVTVRVAVKCLISTGHSDTNVTDSANQQPGWSASVLSDSLSLLCTLVRLLYPFATITKKGSWVDKTYFYSSSPRSLRE